MAYPYEPDGGTFLIEVQHLTKRYGPVTAVDDVSFTVERGEILGFLGPNGAGKTTTMRVLTGYMPPSDGRAIVAGYDVADRACGKLSKGYRQRVGLAQALLHNPEVLILDEPTAGLDPKQIIETRQLIKGLAGDHTIILSTHILPEVSQTCQRVVIINRGKVVAVDTPDHLTSRHRGSEALYLQVDAAGADAAEILSKVSGVTRVAIAETK